MRRIEMKTIGLLIEIFLVSPLLVQGQNTYRNHIQQRVKEYDTPQGNPKLETYLKGLTDDE